MFHAVGKTQRDMSLRIHTTIWTTAHLVVWKLEGKPASFAQAAKHELLSLDILIGRSTADIIWPPGVGTVQQQFHLAAYEASVSGAPPKRSCQTRDSHIVVCHAFL